MHFNLQQFLEWVKEAFTPAYKNEIEEYLNQSTDREDLERRMRELSRKGLMI